jgi:hypothetical protein
MQIYSFNQQHVEITSVYFHKNTKQQRLESYPKRMVYEGREYSFLDGGWRYLVKTGEKLVKLFDVSDGQSQYRLRLDEGNNWTLINIKNQPTNELAIV